MMIFSLPRPTHATVHFMMPRSAMQKEFAELVNRAPTSRFDYFARNLAEWVKDYRWCGGNPHNGTLSQSRNRQLLDVVTLCCVIDTTAKINLLVETYGADVNWVAPSDKTEDLLAKAVQANRSESAHALLSHGADPNARHFLWGRNTFICAIRNNQVDVVKDMHSRGAYLWQSDQFGDSAVVCAVKGSHVELVDFFLKEGVSPNWSDEQNQKTLLHHASYSTSEVSTSVIRLLLNAGANPHLRCIEPIRDVASLQWPHNTNSGFETPIVVAVDETKCGWTPLQYLTHLRESLSTLYKLSRTEDDVLSRNASILSHHMQKDCNDWALAVCMSTHNRLGSDKCGLHQLAVEPGLFEMIMNKVTTEFDPVFPDTPIHP
jgi:ankyrin repeat protein